MGNYTIGLTGWPPYWQKFKIFSAAEERGVLFTPTYRKILMSESSVLNIEPLLALLTGSLFSTEGSICSHRDSPMLPSRPLRKAPVSDSAIFWAEIVNMSNPTVYTTLYIRSNTPRYDTFTMPPELPTSFQNFKFSELHAQSIISKSPFVHQVKCTLLIKL